LNEREYLAEMAGVKGSQKGVIKMEYRVLGKTGLKVSVVGFGGIPIAKVSEDEAVEVVRRAMDLGINLFHTSPTYGDSATKIGRAIRDRREECILNVKIFGVSRERTQKGLESALKMLQTDRIEIVQFRITPEQFEQGLGKEGGLNVLLKAQEEGIIEHIGITDHDPNFVAEAIKTGYFSNVVVPFNYVYNEAREKLIPLALELGVGVAAMKPLGRGALTNVAEALNYIWEHGASTAIVGMKSIREVEENASIGSKVQPLTPKQKRRLKSLAETLLRKYKIKSGALIPIDERA